MSLRGVLRPSTFHTVVSLTGLRCLSISHCRLAVEKGLLSKLRKETGIPFINCKKALEKYDNDFNQAKKWLQEQAQKEGWARATKLQTRPMSQGVVAVLGDHKQVTMLEVNCETDFVARNDKFIEMVTKLVQECNSHMTQQAGNRIDLNQDELNQVMSSEKSSLADIVALTVGNLGENMALRRAAFIRSMDDASVICSYVHPSNSSQKNEGVRLGKYGSVVELTPNTTPRSSDMAMSINDLGSHLCQHIVGMNPKAIGEFSPQSEKESQSEASSPSVNDSTNEQDKDSEASSMQSEQEEEDLLSQEFLLDTTMTVGELMSLNGTDVKDFIRFACGEELVSVSDKE